MSDQLTTVIRQKATFLKLEERFLRKARIFYNLGFIPKNLSASQMSAINEHIYSSGSLEDVKKKVSIYLKKQLKKLESQKDRSGKCTSWLTRPVGIADGESLGDTLCKWINDKKYLENSSEIGEIDRLAALRRFWSNVYGQYRYQQIFNQVMPLEEERLSL